MKSKILFIAIALFALVSTTGAVLAQEAPVITSTPSTTGGVGQAYTYQVESTAPDNGTTTYSLEGATHGALMSGTGLMTWTPTATGSHDFTVRVTDLDSFDEQNFSVTVSAVPAEFSAGDIELGGSSQKRDESILGTIWKVTNIGSDSITDIQLSISGVNSDYQLIATLPTTTLAGGASMDVLIDVFIPDNKDSEREKIGSIQLSGTGASPATRSLYMEAENNLFIDKIEVKVDGKRDTLKSEGTVDEDAEFDDEIEMTITIENTFDENIDIDDIQIDIEADDLDPADGLDDEISTIKDGKDKEVTFTWIMDIDDIDADDAPFTITITIEGEDENGAIHTDEWDIELDMDTKSRDIRFRSVHLADSVITCGDNLRVNYELRNVGTRDLDEAMTKLEIDELDIGIWNRDIELDERDTEDFFGILSIPDDAKPGFYFIELTAYATDRTTDDTDTDVLDFEIKCGDIPEEEEEIETGIDVDLGTVPVEVTGVPVSTSTGTSTSSIRDASTYLIVLGVFAVVLLVIVIMLAVKLLGRD